MFSRIFRYILIFSIFYSNLLQFFCLQSSQSFHYKFIHSSWMLQMLGILETCSAYNNEKVYGRDMKDAITEAAKSCQFATIIIDFASECLASRARADNKSAKFKKFLFDTSSLFHQFTRKRHKPFKQN